ncbi:hypothetical protein [Petropleomorpha daqingensis]|uniref:Uncharacterized protein n=1 Tax=Petropleomorpha daqingensis TaxID=2026353 RepID=A0A853CM92_9ACTN|nr:hypothetical protein [Petropleomorpha daqingensis]NYJ07378.1 hypothetical protein [Petropleomorpha daqingensis]
MNANAPISVVVAGYGARQRAVEDLESVWEARHTGPFHHTAVALMRRTVVDEIDVERSHSTAQHLLWGGALLGGALFVLVPAAGVRMFADVGLDGAGALVYHFRRHADPDGLAAGARLLSEEPHGLVVVTVNRFGEAVAPLLRRAERCTWVDLPWGDLEEELSRDLVSRGDGLLTAVG